MTARSQMAHSSRVEPISETISPRSMPRASRPHAGALAPRRCALRVGAETAAEQRGHRLERRSRLPLLLHRDQLLFGDHGPLASVVSLLRPLFVAPVVGWVAQGSIEHFLLQLPRLFLAVRIRQRIGEEELEAEVPRVLLRGGAEDADRLFQVPLPPGQLLEVAAPEHLRPAVEVVLVDAQRGLRAAAEFALQTLRERGENAHSLG